jgi:hypothetical protein
VDQSLLRDYIGHRFTALPNEYNWKLYWGKPVPLAWGPMPVLSILHFHGPKCVESALLVGCWMAVEVLGEDPTRGARARLVHGDRGTQLSCSWGSWCSIHCVGHWFAAIRALSRKASGCPSSCRLKAALCVLREVRTADPAMPALDAWWDEHNWKLMEDCQIRGKAHPESQMKLLKHAYKADKGELYFEVANSGYFKRLSALH